ncbi:hypothetical protein KM295_14650 [Natronomonas sp. F2-12]|jgi:hypothetical protein|uniref:Uncharacterized protein n=1 Tax=Natronomonas aquatica TaxID=2841590 RepID=A0A9R1D5U2_9EURY|nr:hypothetical protein [Natronomonas aquatica]MCQ4334694.1 hypothetical protein [Natronomonas aquatica]
MTREELRNAADSLRTAADAAGAEARERLEAQAGKLDDHAEADRGPDHGRLAHYEHVLSEIADEEPDAADRIETALDSIRAYRETVEGV